MPISTSLHPGITAGAAVASLFVCLGVAVGGFFYHKTYGWALPNSAGTQSFATPFSA